MSHSAAISCAWLHFPCEDGVGQIVTSAVLTLRAAPDGRTKALVRNALGVVPVIAVTVANWVVGSPADG